MSTPPPTLDNNVVPTDFQSTMNLFNYDVQTQNMINSILNVIINDAYSEIRSKVLEDEKHKFSIHALTTELLVNCSSAFLELGPQIESVDPDDDLELPNIDQWCTGAMEFLKPEEINYRTNQLPDRSPPKMPEKEAVPKENAKPKNQTLKSVTSTKSVKTKPTNSQSKTASSAEIRQQISQNFYQEQLVKKSTPASTLVNKYENFKKQTANANKSITVDSDMNVIPISDPKISSNLLIVPRVTTKRTSKVIESPAQPKKQRQNIQIGRPLRKRQNPTQKLIPADQPVFDNDIPESTTEHIVMKPGVTIRDGTMVKTMPSVRSSDKITKAQYEEYLREVRANSEIV